LIAPAISGACNVYTYGGLSFFPSSAGASGFIRVESANYTGSFNFGSGAYGPSFQGSSQRYLKF
jgi:hypothetical protein